MPDETVWEGFFEPAAALRLLGLSASCRDVVEFGCGYGTFTIPAARIASGTVYALDIDPQMVRRTAEKAKELGLLNVVAIECDFVDQQLPVVSGTADYAMLFNILHAENPEMLLGRASAALHSGGLLGIMHWNYDPKTPRGPSMKIRPRPEDCSRWAEETGFTVTTPHVDLPPWHYGIVAIKR